MKKYILFLFLTSSIFAQVPKTKDSLTIFLKTKPQDSTYVKALNEYAFVLVQEGKIDEAKKTIGQMDNLSKKLKYSIGFYKVMNMRGVIEYTNQNPQKAMNYFLKCNKIIE